MKKILTTLFLLISLLSYGQKVSVKTISIDPHLTFQNYEHFKRLILSSPDSHIEHLEGFEFHWGYKYTIRVEETKLETPLSDGTTFTYTLKQVISITKVSDSTSFNLFLDAKRYYHIVESNEQEMNKTFKQINDSTFLYFDEVEIEVPSFLMEEFSLIVKGEITKMGTFHYLDDKRIRLVKL